MDTAELITSIKVNGAVPADQTNYSDENILRLADEAISLEILPTLLSVKEEYFVLPIRTPIVALKSRYRISPRAVGGVLRDLQYENGAQLKSIAQINPESIDTTSPGSINAFYTENNTVVLYPASSSSTGNLISKIFIRPSKMIVPTKAAQITMIDRTLMQVSVNTVPTTLIANVLVDFVKGTANYELCAIDQTIIAAIGSNLTFSSIPEDLEVGDWISIAGTTPFPNIPVDLHPALAAYTAANILGGMGYADQKAALLETARSSLKMYLTLMSPRVLGEPIKVTTILF